MCCNPSLLDIYTAISRVHCTSHKLLLQCCTSPWTALQLLLHFTEKEADERFVWCLTTSHWWRWVRMPRLSTPSSQVLRLHHTMPSKNCLMGAEHPDFSQVHAPIIPFDSQNIVRHAGRGTSLHFAESDMEAQAGGQQKTQVPVN